MPNFYITTPIYYVNGAPHIGHAYTTIVADVFARHYRQRGDDVFFLTGTDEHGLKIQRAAEESGVAPQELVDENSAKFRDLFDKFELTHDRFIRTTDADHKETVLEMVRRMKESGDVYLDTYEGWYSSSDEAYYTEDEIKDGKAIETGAEVEWVEEASYFFRLSKYEDQLIDWYDDETVPVRPKARRNEIRAFVDGGLRDLSITRTTFDWGIEWPDDPEHVLYVWVDALTNYLTGVGGFDEAGQTGAKWPASMHLIGKDILRFHAVYWPAFLMSAGVELPEQVFAHGWWTVEGDKMSKSKGNWVDAFDLADEYPLDLLRYFMVREIPLGSDGNFVKERIVERNNSELADNLGNLLNRTTKMVQSFIDGEVPRLSDKTGVEADQGLRDKAAALADEVRDAMDAREPHNALDAIMSFAKDLNQYIQSSQPWKYNKEGDVERVQHILYHALEGIRWVAVLASAFIPDAAHEILAALGLTQDEDTQLASLKWGGLPAGNNVVTPDVLFEKIELEELEQEKKQTEKVEKKQKKQKGDSEKAGLVDFKDFMSLELRVGRIETAKPVEGADKLLLLSADVGEDDNRTVVAGLAKSFEPDELVGKQVAMVTNLKPANIFGIKSEAMVLAAETEGKNLELAFFSESVQPGTRIS
jgi:methionyl-tRNA synthetase